MRYAKLGLNGEILNLIQVADADCQDAEGNFNNTIGLQFLENVFPTTLFVPVLSTSVGVAEIGGTWNDTDNVFVSIKPYPSWTFNNTSGKWEASTPNPDPDNFNDPYFWNEENQTWSQK